MLCWNHRNFNGYSYFDKRISVFNGVTGSHHASSLMEVAVFILASICMVPCWNHDSKHGRHLCKIAALFYKVSSYQSSQIGPQAKTGKASITSLCSHTIVRFLSYFSKLLYHQLLWVFGKFFFITHMLNRTCKQTLMYKICGVSLKGCSTKTIPEVFSHAVRASILRSKLFVVTIQKRKHLSVRDMVGRTEMTDYDDNDDDDVKSAWLEGSRPSFFHRGIIPCLGGRVRLYHILGDVRVKRPHRR